MVGMGGDCDGVVHTPLLRVVKYFAPTKIANRLHIPAQRLKGRIMLARAVNLELCPKRSIANVSEYGPLFDLLTTGKNAEWSGVQQTGTLVCMRGIRGEKGVSVASVWIKANSPRWDDARYVEAFVKYFMAAWARLYLSGGAPSSLSHAEGEHAGYSGAHFILTLLDAEIRARLFGPGGLAEQLLPFWENDELQASDVVELCAKVAESRFPLRRDGRLMTYRTALPARTTKRRRLTYDEAWQPQPHVLLRAAENEGRLMCADGYNVMDITRTFYNAAVIVRGKAEILFSEDLWLLMCKFQSRTAKRSLDRHGIIGHVQANSYLSNKENAKGCNWTTFFVCLCEIGQAEEALGEKKFHRLVDYVEENVEQMRPVIERLTADIVRGGARGGGCFCTRLCRKLLGVRRRRKRKLLGVRRRRKRKEQVSLRPH